MKKGISLIVLVITIIVIIILAGAVILSLSQNNPISSATEAAYKANVQAYNSQLAIVISNKYVQDFSFNPKTLYADKWDGTGNITGTVKQQITSMSANDKNKYIIQQGKLIYIGTDVIEKQFADNLGLSDPYIKAGLNLWIDGSDFINSASTNIIDRSNINVMSPTNFDYTANSGSDGNGSIKFDGINDYLKFNSDIDTAIDTFTMSILVKPVSTINIQAESTIGESGVSGQKYAIWPTHGGAVTGSSSNAAAGISIGTNGIGVYEHSDGYLPALLSYPTTINNWVHITVVYKNKQPSLYINGVFVKTGLVSTKVVHLPTFKTQFPLQFGGIGGGYYGSFDGYIRNVSFFNRALTDAEILKNYIASL